MNRASEQDDLPKPNHDAAAWGGGHVTPDSDDLRPFPEVSEEWVDREINEILRAAHAAASRSGRPTPPASES